jgi:hypothetical protein
MGKKIFLAYRIIHGKKLYLGHELFQGKNMFDYRIQCISREEYVS